MTLNNQRSSSTIKYSPEKKTGFIRSVKDNKEEGKEDTIQKNGGTVSTTVRGVSQSKNEKKFYSHNYMSVLANPLSVKRQ